MSYSDTLATKSWDAALLGEYVKSILGGRKVVVVSNREPYRHERVGGEIRWDRPAGGVVTALDPVLQAVGGVWVGHGSGNADKQTADENGRLAVPPGESRYTLRRVWLSKEEVSGYYFGVSNETLWPLCHLAFVRPEFREEHWKIYRDVNQKFAEAVLEEVGDEPALVMVQDYHFALLPKFLKDARPDLAVAHFWHIPWPNPEIFRICPWRQEIIEGLLCNDLLGFHSQHYCRQFLDSVDSELIRRVDRTDQTVHSDDHVAYVRTFPIGIDGEKTLKLANSESVEEEITRLRKQYHLTAEHIAVGVDRLDYTKGIPERLLAIDRFLTDHPEWKEKFQYVGVAAPSRIRIPAYQAIADRVEELVEDINWRHGSDEWKPIVFIHETVGKETVTALYRLGQLCLVTSLHDGMNLVAKEFIASSVGRPGVLLLSCFTGAAHEFPEALLVNPYDRAETADAIYKALTMSEEERSQRMEKMRERVLTRNVYDWARRLFAAAVRKADEGQYLSTT